MHINRYLNQLDDEILTADPVRLIQLLYRGALDSISSARRQLKLGDIRARSRAISKAMAILAELSLALDHTSGGDLSQNLARLYAYIQQLLITANVNQCEPPLEEAERLLLILNEAWEGCLVPTEEVGVANTGQDSLREPTNVLV